MGGAFSGGSLCRIVGGVEIVVSSVIVGFGSQTLHLFYNLDQELRDKFDKLQYSAMTAITQGSLTILASLMILFASRQKPGEPYLNYEDDDTNEEEEGNGIIRKSRVLKPSYISITKRIKRKLAIIYRLWLAFSVISIGLLLIVFLCSMSYCIQNQFDEDRYNEITDDGKNQFTFDDGKKKTIPPCYAESDETLVLRRALSDLYSYCLVNIFALILFMFVVYYQLKRVTRMGHHLEVKEDLQKVLPNLMKENVEEEEKKENGGAGDDKP